MPPVPPCRPTLAPVAIVLVAIAAVPAAAQGEGGQADAADRAGPVRFEYQHQQGDGGGGHAQPADTRGLADLADDPRYGDEGSRWLTFQTGAAPSDESIDVGIAASYNEFIVDDVEYLLELSTWTFLEDGTSESFGVAAALGFRWHFIHRERWTLFADIGIGFLLATQEVPPGGTRFNFMPRAGVGFTRQIAGEARLIGGLRWHHISNARIVGESRNPARDAPLLYVGVVVPF